MWIDGDTISVRLDGARSTIRLTGVDTPETTHPTRDVKPYGPQASDDTTARLTGATLIRRGLMGQYRKEPLMTTALDRVRAA